MELVVFAGVSKTGKTQLMLNCAKLLADSGRSILVLDCTMSQGVSSFFLLTNEEENSLSKCECYYRQGFDIMSDSPYSKNRKLNIGQALGAVNLEDYDYVFLECDYNSLESLVKYASKAVLVYDQSKESLIWFPKSFEIARENDCSIIPIGKDIINCSYDNNFFRNEFCSKLGQDIPEGIVCSFSEQDKKQSLENSILGTISIAGYTEEYKNSLFNLINNFEKISYKEVRKGMRR